MRMLFGRQSHSYVNREGAVGRGLEGNWEELLWGLGKEKALDVVGDGACLPSPQY